MGDFQTTKIVKSRKERVCPECRETIEIGQKYAKEVGCYDGDLYSAIMCVPCKEFADRYVTSMQRSSSRTWDEVTYTFGDIICEAAEFVDYKAPPRQPRPLMRAAILAQFDEFDRQEKEYQKRERENARRAQEHQQRWFLHRSASIRMIREMGKYSAIPMGEAA